MTDPTPARPAPCPHYPHCAGCPLIGRPYGEQLALKQQRVIEALAAFPRLADVGVPPVVGSPQVFGYRNQAKLVVRRARRGVLLGIYRPGSHQVVDISECPVHHPLIRPVLEAVAGAIERFDISVYDERSQTGLLRYVVVRASSWTKSVQVILVTHAQTVPNQREVVRALLRVRGVRSVVQNVNPEPGNVIFGRQFLPWTRDHALVERIDFLKLTTHAGAFLQANVGVARKLYRQALAWAAPAADETCVDLYCGVGALAFYLATQARHVVGIEESAVAVTDAKANIRMNGYHNVRFQCGSVAAVLPEVVARLGPIAIVTLNPPRKGAEAATRAAIVACAPRRVVYVSCEPATLARDLDWFADHHYRTTSVQPFDMMPQTEHVECVALLEREA